ncbi:hypothetical protein Glove_510g15 [Diversispora epigaea]|uniref:Uncharacterized protein n=1 Tax=Diversispora epigaea TaxID=1348612 RepID=A0A397GFQ8_9GLOM|nr:hypothetical protein Glove_510g15 [Diversispora epigaea]
MSRLIAEIESFLLEAPLESICSGSIFYLTMNGDEVADYNTIRNSTERAVRSASQKIENKGRKEKVVNILMEMESGYNTIIGLKALKALNINQESSPDYTQEDIAQNIRTLKMKLSSPMTDADVNLYGALKKSIDENLDISELTWKNPIASTVLSDELDIVKNLNQRQRRTFMEPRENMKCGVPRLISSRVDEFIENFNEIDNFDHIRNIMHDKTWKEDEFELLKTAERILGVLGDIWSNPAFITSTTRSMQSEGTYVTNVIMPLLRASLGDLPNGYICLSTAERQSLASKVRRNDGTGKVKMGKKPDIMALENCDGKLVEFLYRELLDGNSYISSVCRPICNQFGVVGIQVAGEKIYLNVLINNASGIPRYFHLEHAEIPLTSENLLKQAMEQAVSHPPRNTSPNFWLEERIIHHVLFFVYISSVCRPICNQFGVVGIQVAGEKIYLNVLINNASGIPRYFHLEHAEIPLTSENLLKQAMEQAVSHPPRNTSPSPTVTTPEHDYQ